MFFLEYKFRNDLQLKWPLFWLEFRPPLGGLKPPRWRTCTGCQGSSNKKASAGAKRIIGLCDSFRDDGCIVWITIFSLWFYQENTKFRWFLSTIIVYVVCGDPRKDHTFFLGSCFFLFRTIVVAMVHNQWKDKCYFDTFPYHLCVVYIPTFGWFLW